MRYPFGQRILLIAILVLVLLAATIMTSAQAPTNLIIGVIGRADSATARGVELAVERFNNQGNTITPDGKTYRLAVLAQDATSPDQVSSAITTLKTANAFAIFGPEDEALTLASLDSLSNAGAPVFTPTQNSALTPGASLFRTRADDIRLMSALADYAVKDLAKTHIALLQGDPSQGQRVVQFSAALGRSNQKPATVVLQTPAGAITDSAKVLIGAQPDMVIAFGADAQAAALLQALRSQGYTGVFSYPDAANKAFIQALPPEQQAGVVGVTNWLYSSISSASRDFVSSYVGLFGEVPTAYSAAAYDAATALITSVAKSGTQQDALQHQLLAIGKTTSIQGSYNPQLGANALSADVSVFTTGQYGAPVSKAQYNDTGRVALAIVVVTSAVVPTASIPPTNTLLPNEVILHTKNNSNVRSGPGTVYQILGQLKADTTVHVSGLSKDGHWLVIDFSQKQGWVFADVVDVIGDVHNLPVVVAPPPPATLTPLPPTKEPFPDLRVVNVVLNPSPIKRGQAFTATITLQNMGGADAGQFAVATSWLPDGVYTAAIVNGLAAGASTSLNLGGTLNGNPGGYTIAIVVDLNNQINEGPFANNKKYPFTYNLQ